MEIKCPKCGSTSLVKNGHRNGRQQYVCKNCNHRFRWPVQGVKKEEKPKANIVETTITGGISIENFRKKNDVSTRVDKVLRNLGDKLYTIDEIEQATGFRHGFPDLRKTINAHKEYYGTGVADGIIYYGRPEFIAELKREKSMR